MGDDGSAVSHKGTRRRRERTGSAIALLLENSHLTIPGSMRNPSTLPPGSRAEVVHGALGSLVVGPAYQSVGGLYVDAARRVDDGASLITANCGFAIAYQEAVGAAVRSPVALSSLILVPLLARIYHGSLGVLTYDAQQLDAPRRAACGWPRRPAIPVQGVRELSEWAKLDEVESPAIDVTLLREQLVASARAFCAEHRLLAVLLECTAMAPFRRQLHIALGVSVFDIVGLIDFLANRPVIGAFDARQVPALTEESVPPASKKGGRDG